ncbi:YgfZ/GcvT domain-containing protein [Alteraurantiacibacter aquimixticola]|uniref:Folate-binding protein n=1 Tax=Alteraurantiacibacter aquimixticola TaxID=2489173 RepID=A0A4V4U8N4_9SPHN|nr:folate-binding protein YgfZ [Alteraurantiacibacter aquimixticola]TIX50553.1 folate-binding protein [Alteraurantiacibacter aquimixticola]
MVKGRLASRAVVRISPREAGEDVADFLQGLLTNNVTGDLPAYAALLSAQGKALFDMIVWRDGDSLLLDCEAEVAEELVKRLSLYRLRRKIDIAVDPDCCVTWSAPDGEEGNDPRLSALGHRAVETSGCEDLPAVDDAWLAHRLALGVPEGRAELGDILWLETNAAELNGVSFTKGCYVGQENTARMNWRQKVNRRLVVVPIEQSDPKRQRVAYPALGNAVDHLRVDDIPADLIPDWMELSENPAD